MFISMFNLHTYIYNHIRIYIYIYIYICPYTYIYIYRYVYICIHVHIQGLWDTASFPGASTSLWMASRLDLPNGLRRPRDRAGCFGLFKGDIDIGIHVDVEVDVDIDRYFGSSKRGFKVRLGTAE